MPAADVGVQTWGEYICSLVNSLQETLNQIKQTHNMRVLPGKLFPEHSQKTRTEQRNERAKLHSCCHFFGVNHMLLYFSTIKAN